MWHQQFTKYCPSPAVVRLDVTAINQETGEEELHYITISWGDGKKTEARASEYYLYHAYYVDKPTDEKKFTITVTVTKLANGTEINPVSTSITPDVVVYGRWSNTGDIHNKLDDSGTITARVGETIPISGVVDSAILARIREGSVQMYDHIIYIRPHTEGTWPWISLTDNPESFVDYGKVLNADYRVDKFQMQIKINAPGIYDLGVRSYGYRAGNLTTYPQAMTETSYYASGPTYRVLAPPTPSIVITDYRDKYNNHTLEGHPPYTVTVQDTSMQTQQYQPAITRRMINFGDPDSGQSNIVDLDGSTTTATHVFDGYGPYTITLTIYNEFGESATSTVVFSPSQIRRITMSKVEFIRRTFPPIDACTAEVAGANPTPTVTWSYQLQGDPGYYHVEKQGTYAEFPFLAAGKYDLYLTVKQEGQPDLVKAWIVTIDERPPIPSNPQTLQDFVIWQYDSATNQRIALLDNASDIRIQWNFQTGKTLSFRLPATYPNLQSIRAGTLLAVGFGGIARPFVITNRNDSSGGTGGGEGGIITADYIEIEAVDYAEVLFESRIALVATRSTSDNGYDIQTCSPEALLRYYAITNLIDDNREDPRFKIVGTNHDWPEGRGGTPMTYSARYETTDEIITSICSDSGLGWEDQINDANNYVVGWQPVLGVNRTVGGAGQGITPVIMSAQIHTATVDGFTESLSKSVAVGAGQGTGATRDYTSYDIDGNTPTVSGILRREVFVDATEAGNADEIKRMAVLELLQSQSLTLTVNPLPTGAYQLGRDYQVGDSITIYDPKIGSINARVLSADCAKTEKGTSITLTCGTDKTNYSKILLAQSRANSYARK